jgi:uncharacterized C2H2 Zn-finger protein
MGKHYHQLVKCPRSGSSFFYMDNKDYIKAAYSHLVPSKRMAIVAQMYKDLTSDARTTYEEKARKDRQRYYNEITANVVLKVKKT